MADFFCRDCHGQVRDSDKYCPYCGVRAPASSNPLFVLNSSPQPSQQAKRKIPRENQGVIVGALSCLFGVLGIFTLGIIFVPIAILFALDGISRGINGNGTGLLVSFVGGVLAAVGFAMSPTLWVVAAGLLASQGHKDSAAPAPTPTVASAPAPTSNSMKDFDGLWVQTDAECLDQFGRTRTLIASDNKINGKVVPLFERYESHCVITNEAASEGSMALSGTCYEFWEDFTKRRDGRKTTFRLARMSNGITIDGNAYHRCENIPVKNAR